MANPTKEQAQKELNNIEWQMRDLRNKFDKETAAVFARRGKDVPVSDKELKSIRDAMNTAATKLIDQKRKLKRFS